MGALSYHRPVLGQATGQGAPGGAQRSAPRCREGGMSPAYLLAHPLRACTSCPACRRTTTTRAALYAWIPCGTCGVRIPLAWVGRGSG